MSFSSQGAEEAFNQTIQIQLSAAFDYIIQEITWDFELNLWKLIHSYNCCRKYVTPESIPKYAIDNYNYKSLMEKVGITNENSSKLHLEKMSIMRVMLSYSQIGY